MTANKNRQKVFLALWPGESVRTQLYARSKRLKGLGKKVPIENLHMTLVFIGYADAQQLRCIQDIASQIQCNKFQLSIDRVGSFRKSILWLGCTNPPQALFDLQANLSDKLREYCGFHLEKGKYMPHITIERKIKQTPSMALSEPLNWEVNNFVLVKSEPGNITSQYTVIDSWSLFSS